MVEELTPKELAEAEKLFGYFRHLSDPPVFETNEQRLAYTKRLDREHRKIIAKAEKLFGGQMKGRAIDPAKKAKVLERINAGESARKVADDEGVSYSSVMNWKHNGQTKPAKIVNAD